MGAAVNYQPNSFGGPVEAPAASEPPVPVDGDGARYNHRDGNDDFGQAGDLFRLMSADQRNRLLDTIAAAMADVPTEIQHRQIGHFSKADPAYGAGVASRLGLATPTEEPVRHGVGG